MKNSRVVLAAAIAAGVLVGVVLTVGSDRQSNSNATETAPGLLPVGLPVAGAAGAYQDFAALAERLRPSVVNLATVSEPEEPRARRRGGGTPFEDFFGRRGPSRSLGSGLILDEEGYIITNHHVVEGATKVVVKLHDETEHEAEVIGTDAKTDLAVIKIEPTGGLSPAALGDSDQTRVGEWVLAVGNPFGLGHTVTAGIVSAKGRRINRPDASPYDDFIQTDAAINPGNSGGPLINMAGQVVGINSAIFSRGGGNIGIGFAIPANMARRIVPQLKEHGRVTRGWLGVLIQPVTEDIAESLELDEAKGALVAKVFDGSPAEAAGVEIGDVIVSFDGKEVVKSADLPSIVADTPVGKRVDVEVVRESRTKIITVEIAKLAEEKADVPVVAADVLGLSVQDMTSELAREFRLDQDARGVVVTSVDPESAAATAGIRPGDIIEMVGNSPIGDADEFRERVAERDEGEGVLVLVRRGDQTLFRVIKPDEE